MKTSAFIFKELNKLFNKVSGIDLSADQRSQLFDLKELIYHNTIRFENKIQELIKDKPKYVIKMLEDGKFMGYVENLINIDDIEYPIVPTLMMAAEDVENEVFDTEEEAQVQINMLNNIVEPLNQIEPDEPKITYEIERREN